MMRYILEGEWTGYTSSQRRVVHREIVTDRARLARLRNLHAIVYTDGTSLLLDIREAKRGERIQEIHAYDSLIREAERQNKSRVLVSEMAAA